MRDAEEIVDCEARSCGLIGRQGCTSRTICTYCVGLAFKERDAEWKARVEAANADGTRRVLATETRAAGQIRAAQLRGWEQGVRESIDELAPQSCYCGKQLLALIVRGPK